VCHSTTAWTPAQFNHGVTSFPLTGAHRTATCAACHAGGYTGTPADCYACHQTDYTGAVDPNHVASGYPTLCATCHSTTAWAPAQFDHNTTAFPLTGAHRTATCVACHAGGYSGTQTDCYACHQTDYAQTNNPGHTAASFPTACATCHSTTAWTPSSWDHEPHFPIRTGKHTSLACTQCHVTSSNYAAFECILCHEHNQTDMAGKHEGRPDYQWASSACYACHPQGRS
jgi:predicted CXXCH cytochrome family protein